MGNILFEWGMKCTFLMSKCLLVVSMQNMLTWMIKETRASIGLKGLLHNFEFQSQHSRPVPATYYAAPPKKIKIAPKMLTVNGQARSVSADEFG